MTAWQLVQGHRRRTRMQRIGSLDTWVELTADGKRWCVTFQGTPESGLDGHRLMTWETAEGAMAHVERRLRGAPACRTR